jgi:hypothetical protein
MRNCSYLTIDGDTHPWDLTNNACIVYFLVSTYGKIKGFIKSCGTHEKCWELLKIL